MRYGEEWLADPITGKVLERLDEASRLGYIRLLSAARDSRDANVAKLAAAIDVIQQLKTFILEQGEPEDE